MYAQNHTHQNAYQFILQKRNNLFTKTCQNTRKKKQLFNHSHLCQLVITIQNKALINEIQVKSTKVSYSLRPNRVDEYDGSVWINMLSH